MNGKRMRPTLTTTMQSSSLPFLWFNIFLIRHTRWLASLGETFYLHLLEAWNITGPKIITDIFRKKKTFTQIRFNSTPFKLYLMVHYFWTNWFTTIRLFVLGLLQVLFFLSIPFKLLKLAITFHQNWQAIILQKKKKWWKLLIVR